MTDLKLFKYANIPKDVDGILVLQKTSTGGDNYTEYADNEKVRKAYVDGAIRDKIKRWILSENLVVLTGAGTSITTGEEGLSLDAGGVRYTGKSVWSIWEKCKVKIPAADITELQTRLDEPDTEFNLERFLSKIEIYVSANGKSTDKTVKSIVDKCNSTRDIIIAILKEECDLTLHPSAPHTKFLRDILSARGDLSRMQLFTLNYDTVFEQAAEEGNATIIDGFAFSRNPIFNGSNFDLDVVKRSKNRVQHNENYEEKVFQLYKLHGSLDWRKDSTGERVIRVQAINDPREVVFIPPSVHKFEQSYDMPYFEMMSRFQQSLRRENTTLIVIGYSFGDAHINRVIIEALNSNLNFELALVSPTATKDSENNAIQKLHQLINNGQSNITMISDTFKRFTQNLPSLPAIRQNKPDVEVNGIEEDPISEIPF